jgi:hypothetical protein
MVNKSFHRWVFSCDFPEKTKWPGGTGGSFMYWKILTDKNTENVTTGNLDDKELTHLALTRMADEDYYNGIEGLNTQQKTAFELVQSYSFSR